MGGIFFCCCQYCISTECCVLVQGSTFLTQNIPQALHSEHTFPKLFHDMGGGFLFILAVPCPSLLPLALNRCSPPLSSCVSTMQATLFILLVLYCNVLVVGLVTPALNSAGFPFTLLLQCPSLLSCVMLSFMCLLLCVKQ